MRCIARATLKMAMTGLLLGAAPANGAEPLSVHLHARTRWGGTTFLQGAPIHVTVSLVNAELRRAEEAALEQWRSAAQQAEKTGQPPPARPTPVQAAPDAGLRVSDDNVAWLERVELHIQSTDQRAARVFENVRWAEHRVAPEKIDQQPAVVSKNPVWSTLEILPQMSATLPAGEYRLDAGFPNAAGDSVVIRVKPVETDAEQAALEYELAEYALAAKQYDQAIEHAQHALGKLPLDRDMPYLTLGDAYAARKDWKRAVEAYEKLLAAYGDSETWEYGAHVRALVEELKKKIR